jgi:hypothetical protein
VAEGARLESVFTRKGNVGSNPTLSASKSQLQRKSTVPYPEIRKTCPYFNTSSTNRTAPTKNYYGNLSPARMSRSRMESKQGNKSVPNLAIRYEFANREQAFMVRSQIGPYVHLKNRPHHSAVGSKCCSVCR